MIFTQLKQFDSSKPTEEKNSIKSKNFSHHRIAKHQDELVF